jgi:predicted AAA+ superfamily ATPase
VVVAGGPGVQRDEDEQEGKDGERHDLQQSSPGGIRFLFGGATAIFSAKVATIERALRDPGSHFFLFGPRGTGKSTWLRDVFPDALVIDLLAPEVERRYGARPERLRELVAGNPKKRVVVVDEVQRVPELLSVVHQLVETPGDTRFVLTGSSSRKLKRTGVDLLAGRAVVRTLHPFLAAELGDAFDLERALREGLVPLVWAARNPADTLAAYAGLYVREEVQAEGLVRNVGGFTRFLESVSFSHASLLNASEVARECEVSRKTVEGYLEILEDLLLSFRVPVFDKRARRRLTSRPKLFLFDAGVFRSLRPAGPLDRPEEIEGAALEGLVAQHLRAWCEYSGTDHRLYFWRTKSGVEVDFVVYGPNGIDAIEVKRTREVRSRDLRGLRAFLEDYPEARARVLHMGDERRVVDGVECVPCAEFLAGVRPGQPLG